MQTRRASVGLTRKALADRLGVNQPVNAELACVGDHEMEDVLHSLGELGAEFMVTGRHCADVVQVSDHRDRLLAALPPEVDDRAAAAGVDLDAFVLQARCEARTRTPRRATRRREAQPSSPV